MTGRVIKFFEHKHFGFIREDETQTEWFFHELDVLEGEPLLQRGATVEFEKGQFNNRPKATHVHRASPETGSVTAQVSTSKEGDR